MKHLFTTEEVQASLPFKRFKTEHIARAAMRLLKLHDVNTLYSNACASESPMDFIDRILEQIDLEFHISEKDLQNLPKEGAFITVSNHPYGGIDGLILMRLVGAYRPDFKVLANYLLERIEPLNEMFLPVNPFEQRVSRETSLAGMRAALTHLRAGKALGCFPAGEVSSIHGRFITDTTWNKSAIKLMAKAEVPIVPIYFGGSNSLLFHLLGMINPLLRTARLPGELMNKQHRRIEVRIGKPIKPSEQKQFEDLDQLGRYIRSKTYALGTALEVKPFFQYSLRRKKEAQAIGEPPPAGTVKAEIEALGKKHFLLRSSNYDVYCAPSQKLPHTLMEIGRLREITYRAEGEGTHQAYDIDEFDLYYHHLIIWDRDAACIVGGYRIGKGSEIMQEYSVKGFYIRQLFKIRPKLYPMLSESLELGRSFIVQSYQRKPLPLFLLWKGILVFLLKHPNYRYLTGPVSISNQFSGFSKGILIEFLKRNFYDADLAQSIKPKQHFRVPAVDVDIDILLRSSQQDLSKLDQLIEDIEPMGLRLPVLFKKYIKQNAKVIGFNTDPKFNNALDGLMVLDIYDVPSQTIISLMRELNDPSLEKAMMERNLVA